MSGDVKANTKDALVELARQVESVLAPLGYEAVALEQTNNPKGGGRVVTLFIDFLDNASGSRRIGLDDCVTVNKAVDELFENTPLLEGRYDLEVSSPGIERPLRKPEDFERFAGRKARLHTFRALEIREAGNDAYWERNQRQKNFIGRLEGLAGGKVRINIDGQAVEVPLELISKAHLEADWEEMKKS